MEILSNILEFLLLCIGIVIKCLIYIIGAFLLVGICLINPALLFFVFFVFFFSRTKDKES